ncbi:MAG: hypothetical protein COX29_01195 [Candidatus Moranbacteria bacterium CG23_combo_of_CG06-09_8_20_14_all_35_22]|nr:MAG: hypothetical protein COX29_01195 [Candidatus Moranbacteria bacterium CG23_combo_of_CG06-09_8_20_14_all_35_22]
MRTKKNFLKIILGLSLLIIFVGLVYGAFFIWKITNTENKINIKNENTVSFLDTFKNIVSPGKINLQGMDQGRINILLLGIAGQGKPGRNLTDTIMIASFNTKTGQTALLSIPRDLFVEVPKNNYTAKINSIYEYGLQNYPADAQKSIEPIRKTIENITSLDINYWAVINFDGFQKAVDAIGGINITNEFDIFDPRYPGPNYSYETFELSKGFHHLDGATALKYARMRHNDPESDFGRAKRQQQVMQTIKNKIFSTGTLLNPIAINQFLNTLGENVKTNIASSEFADFVALIKNLDTNNINNVVLDAWKKDSLLRGSHITGISALIPRVSNWSEVQELAQNIFDTNKIKRKREEIDKENATVVIINKSGNSIVSNRINKLLKENFGYKNVVAISATGQKTERQTFVYDLTGGKKLFTLNELVEKLPARNASPTSNASISDANWHSDAGEPAKASSNWNFSDKKSIGNITADLVLIIGKDLIPHYSLAEVDFKDYNEDSE